MKIKHTDIQEGDVFLAAQNGKLGVFKCERVTKSGSIKASFYDWHNDTDPNKPTLLYYESRLVTDVEKFNKTKYFSLGHYNKGEYEGFYWLLEREERR